MNKNNNVLIKNILILLSTGVIAKIIGMFGKIIYTRTAGVKIVSLYTLLTPTFMLIISLCQFSFPIAISKLSAETTDKLDNKKLLISAYIIGYIIDIVLMILIMLTSKLIAKALNNLILYKVITSVIFIIPFVTTTSIMHGFLHGKEDMFPASITNITEEIIKLLLTIFILPIAIIKGNIYALISIILFNIITELVSILIMNKHIKKYITNDKVLFDKKISNKILKISVPTTLIRLISAFGFFLEPILLTKLLINKGFSYDYITLEYGIINSYVIPILSMPNFFFISIASALLPNITKLYKNNKQKEFKNKIKKLLFLTIILGIFSILIIMLFPKNIMNIIYKAKFGINYIYLLAPFFILLYLQPTLSVVIQSINKTNKLLYISCTSIIIKYLILFITSNLNFGINSYIYSVITGLIVTTLLIIYEIKKEIN